MSQRLKEFTSLVQYKIRLIEEGRIPLKETLENLRNHLDKLLEESGKVKVELKKAGDKLKSIIEIVGSLRKHLSRRIRLLIRGDELSEIDRVVRENIASIMKVGSEVEGSEKTLRLLERFINLAKAASEEKIIEEIAKTIPKYEVPRVELDLDKMGITDLIFIGDLHGDYKSLETAVKYILQLEDKGRRTFTVFLGDYVDRGPQQLECLVGALTLHEILPGRVLTLRGNHEDPQMNFYYGFITELSSRVRNFRKIYDEICKKIYVKLPILAVLNYRGKRILCVHGGIPIKPIRIQEEKFKSKLFYDPSDIEFQILWNDPFEGLETYAPNERGEGIYYFGSKIVEEFMKVNELNFIVRSHRAYYPKGYKIFFKGKLYSIFTCRYYEIPPTILHIENNKIGIVELTKIEET